MSALQIDMQRVAMETAEALGAQIGSLTSELIAQRQVATLLHAEVDRLQQALASSEGDTETRDRAPESAG